VARKVKSKTAEAVDSGSRWKRGQRRAQRTMESPRNETPTQGRFAPLNGAPDLQIIDLTRVTWATRPLLGSRSVPENLSIVPDLWFLSHSNHPSKKGRAH